MGCYNASNIVFFWYTIPMPKGSKGEPTTLFQVIWQYRKVFWDSRKTILTVLSVGGSAFLGAYLYISTWASDTLTLPKYKKETEIRIQFLEKRIAELTKSQIQINVYTQRAHQRINAHSKAIASIDSKARAAVEIADDLYKAQSIEPNIPQSPPSLQPTPPKSLLEKLVELF